MHARTCVTSKDLSWEHISKGFNLPGDSDGKCLPAMQETRVQSLGQENPWRRKWQPTSVLWPRKFHGWRSLVGYSPWGRKESDTTEQLHYICLSIRKNEISVFAVSKQIAYDVHQILCLMLAQK